MSGDKSYYLTTPIYYVNDEPHIGHAYTTLACDALARFKRLDGFDVRFLTGTDEHGQKVEKAAADAGIDPQTFTDKISQNFRHLAEAMNFSNDDFIRTTEQRHLAASQAIWNAIAANKSPKGRDNIYLDKYAGWYAVRDEAFFAENELTKDENGQFLAPSGAPVEWVEEPSYFFRLSDWQDALLAFYETNPDAVAPNTRRNEVISFVSGGLKDLSISRTTFNWGIPVPGDDAHIMYVWLDALTNYITAVGYPETDSESFRTYWPADLHMVGKDILRFHAVYWPAFLMAAGIEPATRVFAHGWWTNEGQKISKSVGNVIDPLEQVEKFGLDQVRYFLLREVPFGNDGDFSREAMIHRINSDLANDLGNLCQRVLSFIAKNAGGVVPEPSAFTADDHSLRAGAEIELPLIRDAFDEQAFHKALEAIWSIVGEANRYVDAQAPWALRKTDPDRMATVLYVLLDAIRQVGILVQPFMPESAAKILDLLAVAPNDRDFGALGRELEPGTALPKPSPVFPRYVDEAAE
jgi:methionyl-tRNA synthetase